MTFGAEHNRFGQVSPGLDAIPVRFAKPFTVTIASAALLALPFTGSALADGARPQPAPTAKAPHTAPAKQVRKDDRHKDKIGRAHV